jgi:hypothetical protein
LFTHLPARLSGPLVSGPFPSLSLIHHHLGLCACRGPPRSHSLTPPPACQSSPSIPTGPCFAPIACAINLPRRILKMFAASAVGRPPSVVCHVHLLVPSQPLPLAAFAYAYHLSHHHWSCRARCQAHATRALATLWPRAPWAGPTIMGPRPGRLGHCTDRPQAAVDLVVWAGFPKQARTPNWFWPSGQRILLNPFPFLELI